MDRLVEAERGETEKIIETIDQLLGDILHCIESQKRTGDTKAFYKEFIKLYHVNFILLSDM